MLKPLSLPGYSKRNQTHHTYSSRLRFHPISQRICPNVYDTYSHLSRHELGKIMSMGLLTMPRCREFQVDQKMHFETKRGSSK